MEARYVKLNRLEFLTTTICNAKCKHCSVNHNRRLEKHIDKDVAVDTIKRLAENYDLQSVMTFGGEPLLFPELIFAIHEEATKVGIPNRQIITNGFWSRDDEKIAYIANRLAEAGVNKILISVDAFHQEYIPLEVVRKTAQELINVSIDSIKWSPCWLRSQEDDNEYNRKTKKILEELEDLSIPCGSGNVVSPQGAAVENLSEFFHTKVNLTIGKCGDLPYTDPLDSIKSICIEPNGDIGICRDFVIGNVMDADILEVLYNYNPYDNKYMKAILDNGIKGLVEMAEHQGLAINKKDFHSMCDMCTYLRKGLGQ